MQDRLSTRVSEAVHEAHGWQGGNETAHRRSRHVCDCRYPVLVKAALLSREV